MISHIQDLIYALYYDLMPIQSRAFSLWMIGGAYICAAAAHYIASRIGTQRALIGLCFFYTVLLAICLSASAWLFGYSWSLVLVIVAMQAGFYYWLVRNSPVQE